MSLGSNAVSLAALTKDLSLRWEQTKESWQDAKSLEFERKYMAELLSTVNRAAAVFEQLDKILSKVRSDCE